jgi:preprotein translocase subunit SecY
MHFVPGIRPGDQTARYIDGVLARLTMFALCISRQYLMPCPDATAATSRSYFGGTSLLIVVAVVMISCTGSIILAFISESVMKKK